MPEVKNVSGTAFVVAEFRAEENDEAYPLYRDSIVELFLNEQTRQAAGRVAASFPHVKDMVKIRTKYLDDTLEQTDPFRFQSSRHPWGGAGHPSREKTSGWHYLLRN